MSGGVRNLRAMFENKDTSTSPPADRGRSPGGSTGAASSGTSPRPLSKIRTSFVTVEKSGQMGLQLRRDTSGEPSLAKRRTSFSIDEQEHPEATAQRKASIASELDARKNSVVISEAIPESAIETPTLEVDRKLGGPREALKTSKAEGKKPASSTTSAVAPTSNGRTNGHPKVAVKPVEKSSPSKATTRPTPISTAKATTVSKASPTKSPLLKTPTTPRGRGRPDPAKKEPDKKLEKVPRASLAPSQSSKPATRPTTSGTALKTRIQASPPQTGFVKPKPRSPTRPVKLPASLTAHTASSGSKSATAPAPTSKQSLSRASGNAQPVNSLQAHQTNTRSPSRGSTASLSRQGSTINKSSGRPSLGPPPATLKKQTSRQSLPQQTALADGAFLARMMRPTTSSSSKTLEKQPDTPPKKIQPVKRPTTKDGPSKPREDPKVISSVPKPKAAVVSKPVAKETKAKTVVVKKEEPKKKAESAVQVTASKADVPGVAGAAALSGALETPEDQVDEAAEKVVKGDEDMQDESSKPEETNEEEPAVPAVEHEPIVEEEAVLQTEESEVVATEAIPEPAKDIPTTSVEPPTPVVAEHVVRQEEVEDTQPEIAEEAAEEEVEAEEEKEAETIIPDPKESEIVKSKSEPVEPDTEPVPVEEPEQTREEPQEEKKVIEQVTTKPAITEDPEDVKAREEIAKLNAEVLKVASEAESEVD